MRVGVGVVVRRRDVVGRAREVGVNGGGDPGAVALVAKHWVGGRGSGVVALAAGGGGQRKMGKGRSEGWIHTWQPPVNPRPTERARIVPKARSGHGESKKRQFGGIKRAPERARASGASEEEWTRERSIG